jgi:hypothetical protein
LLERCFTWADESVVKQVSDWKYNFVNVIEYLFIFMKYGNLNSWECDEFYSECWVCDKEGFSD